MRTDRVKDHFEKEAAEFDGIIRKLIPHYDRMIAALVSIIPFREDQHFGVLDLGCGTGAVSRAIVDKFPKVELTCVDLSEKMLQMAKTKLGDQIECIQADFNAFEFPQQYDLIVSSLALHHLVTDNDKLMFYKKIYSALKPDGQFINIDVVLASSEVLQSVYMKKWKEFMAEHVTREEIEQKWLPNYAAEDHPAPMLTHLDMMKSCGFNNIDVVYKYYKFAVYTGSK